MFAAYRYTADMEDEEYPGPAVGTTVVVQAGGGAAITLFDVDVASGASVVVSWGDGSTTTYAESPAALTHTYSRSGEYEVTVSDGVERIYREDKHAISPVVEIRSIGPHVQSVDAYAFRRASLRGTLPFIRHAAAVHPWLGPGAFADCRDITSFEKAARSFSKAGQNPSTTVGEGLFAGCTSLATLAGLSRLDPVSARCFAGCTSLTSLAGGFSPSCMAFADFMFDGCTSLTSLSGVPSSLANLGIATFRGCTSLASLSALASTNVTELPASCFYGCTSLSVLTGAEYIEVLGVGCFRGCWSLASLAGLGSSLVSIPGGCFADCFRRVVDSETGEVSQETGLSSLAGVPSGVVYLGEGCFSGDRLINSLAPLAAVTMVGDECFRGCSGVMALSGLSSDVDFSDPANRVELGAGAFSMMYDPLHYVRTDSTTDKEVWSFGGLIDADWLEGVNYRPGDWTRGGDLPPRLFEGDALLLSVPGLPANATGFGSRCFAGCRSIENLDALAGAPVASGVPYIGDECFADCTWTGHEAERPVVNDQQKTLVYASDISSTAAVVAEVSTRRGLAHIGGMAVWFAKYELASLLDSLADVDVSAVFMRIWDRRHSLLSPDWLTDMARYNVFDALCQSSLEGAWQEAIANIEAEANYSVVVLDGIEMVVVLKKEVDEFGSVLHKVEIPAMLMPNGAAIAPGAVIPDIAQVTGDVMIHEFSPAPTGFNGPFGLFLSGVTYSSYARTFTASVDLRYKRTDGTYSPAYFSEVVQVQLGSSAPPSTASAVVARAWRMLALRVVSDLAVSGDCRDTVTGAVVSMDSLLGVFAGLGSNASSLYDAFLLSGAIVRPSTLLGAGCFRGCDRLVTLGNPPSASVHSDIDGFPRYVSVLPDECFAGTGVSTLVGLSCVAEMGEGCFSDAKIDDLDGFPEGMTHVPSRCFAGCPLTALAPLASGTSFAPQAFDGCDELEDLESDPVPARELWSAVSSLPSPRLWMDKYARSRFARVLARRVFRGTAVTSLATEIPFIRIGEELGEHTPADYVGCLLPVDGAPANGRIAVRMVPCGNLSSSTVKTLLMFEFGGERVVFRAHVDTPYIEATSGYHGTDNDNKPGLDGTIANGCVSGFALDSTTPLSPSRGDWADYSSDWAVPAYNSHMSDQPTARTVVPNCTSVVGPVSTWSEELPRAAQLYMLFDPQWFPSGQSQLATDGDAIEFVSGPYRFKVRLCFGVDSKTITADTSGYDRLSAVSFKLKGFNVVSCAPVEDLPSGWLVSAPLFPRAKLDDGCVEGTQLTSLAGLPPSETTLPSRCFAGVSFYNPVSSPEPPVLGYVTEMPVLDKRVDEDEQAARRYHITSYDRDIYNRIIGFHIEAYSQYASAREYIEIAVTRSGGSGSPISSFSINQYHAAMDPCTVRGESLTPTAVSVDADGVVVAFGSQFSVRYRTEWDAAEESFTIPDGAIKIMDPVADHMRQFKEALAESSRARIDGGTDEESPEVSVAPAGLVQVHSGVEEPIDESRCLAAVRWDRQTGVPAFFSYVFTPCYVGGTSQADSVHRGDYDACVAIDGGPSSDFPPKTLAAPFACAGTDVPDDEWIVWVGFKTKSMRVADYSVDVPGTITDIARDCFTFDGYPDRHPIEQVNFPDTGASTVRAMSGFPFGVPDGCLITCRDTIAYGESEEPLPSP